MFVVLLVIDPTSHELGSPAKPGRFSVFGPLAAEAKESDAENGAGADDDGAAAGDDAEQEVEIEEADEDEDEAAEPAAGADGKPGKACIAGHPGAATSNQTLLQWLPRCGTVAELWDASVEDKTQARVEDDDALVRVAYQCRTDVTWNGDTQSLAGRTLEEAFALENLAWCQDKARKPLQLRIAKPEDKDLMTLATRIHKRVQAKSFNKTDFALALLAEEPAAWSVPTYIAEGLQWLEGEIAPPQPDEDDGEGDQADEAAEAVKAVADAPAEGAGE